jgi:GDPmannose 4,6-dehydratase
VRTALVTGATGQTGSYLVELLAAEGVEVHAAVRPDDRTLPWQTAAQVHRHAADLFDGPGLARLVFEVAPDTIFHLGGLTSVAESWDRGPDYARAIAVATSVLVDAASQLDATGHPISFVHASSAEIFGRPEVSPQDEHTPIAPVSPYGAAKAHAHVVVRLARERGLAAGNAILFNHESPRRPPIFVTRKITSGVADIAAGRAATLSLGNLDARRDWGWAPDYAAAILRIADDPDDYVIATGVARSVRDFVSAAFAAVGIDDWTDLVVTDPRFLRPSDAPKLVGDSGRARERLGWAPTIGFDEMVARMVAVDLE